jgi:hypothetical protein
VTVNKKWTREEALDAQLAFEDGGGDILDPAGPYKQWNALQSLEALEEAYTAGGTWALLRAVGLCATHRLVMPDWMVRELEWRLHKADNLLVKSWDEVFDPLLPRGRGKSFEAARKRHHNRWTVYTNVHLEKQKGELPIGDALFAKIGKPLGMSGSSVRDLYYETCKLVDEIEHRVNSKNSLDPL